MVRSRLVTAFGIILGIGFGIFLVSNFTLVDRTKSSDVTTENMQADPITVARFSIGDKVVITDCGLTCTKWSGDIITVEQNEKCDDGVRYFVQYKTQHGEKIASRCENRLTEIISE